MLTLANTCCGCHFETSNQIENKTFDYIFQMYQYIECWECCSCSCYYSVRFLPHPRVRFVWLWDLDLFAVLFVYVCMYVCMYVFWCYFGVILVLFWCYFGIIFVFFLWFFLGAFPPKKIWPSKNFDHLKVFNTKITPKYIHTYIHTHIYK